VSEDIFKILLPLTSGVKQLHRKQKGVKPLIPNVNLKAVKKKKGRKIHPQNFKTSRTYRPGKTALPHESSQGVQKLSEAVFCIPHRRDNAFFPSSLQRANPSFQPMTNYG